MESTNQLSATLLQSFYSSRFYSILSNIIMSSTSSYSQQPVPLSHYLSQFTPLHFGTLSTKCVDGCFYNHYYCLTAYRLLQYESCSSKNILLCIDFRSIQLKSFHRCERNIKIQFCNYKLVLKAGNEEEARKWATELSIVIGNCTDICHSAASKPNFSQVSITYSQLSKFADTFDILLFKSINRTAKLQRFLTGSTYDHIGMLLLTQNNQLFMIEVNSKTGVCLLNQQSIRNKIKNSVKAGYRKLMGNRNNSAVIELQKSLAGFLGSEFEFGFGKIFGKVENQEENTDRSEKRTYFCSELVADIYKKCGLLKSNKEARKYWPQDFEKDMDGVEFGMIMSLEE